MSADAVLPTLPAPAPAQAVGGAPASAQADAAAKDDGAFAALLQQQQGAAAPATPNADAKATDAKATDAKALEACPVVAQLTTTPDPGEEIPAAPGALALQVVTGAEKPKAATADVKAAVTRPAHAAETEPEAAPQEIAPSAPEVQTAAAPPTQSKDAPQDKPTPAPDSAAAPQAQPDPALVVVVAVATPPTNDNTDEPTPLSHGDEPLPVSTTKPKTAAPDPRAAAKDDPSAYDLNADRPTPAAASPQRAAHASEGKGAPAPSTAAPDGAVDVRPPPPPESGWPTPAAAAPASNISAPVGAHAGATAAVATAAVAQEIVRRFDGGNTSFQMRLDPPELGRVDIKLEVSRDRKVTATISADNPATLNDLRASSRELQRALTESGLDLADNGLSFSDRRQQSDSAFTDPGRGGLRGETESIPEVTPAPSRPLYVQNWGGARIDMWA